MLSRPWLTSTSKAAAAAALIVIGLLCLSSCSTKPSPPPQPPPVTYSETYDKEIKDIMDLANENRWEEAETKVNAL